MDFGSDIIRDIPREAVRIGVRQERERVRRRFDGLYIHSLNQGFGTLHGSYVPAQDVNVLVSETSVLPVDLPARPQTTVGRSLSTDDNPDRILAIEQEAIAAGIAQERQRIRTQLNYIRLYSLDQGFGTPRRNYYVWQSVSSAINAG